MNILDEAAELINGQRAKDYGDVAENFQRIADLWQTYLDGIHPINKIDCHDVAMMMILVKVARQSNGYHRDSAVDIAGYAALDEKLHPAAPTFTLKFDGSPNKEFWEDIDQSIVEAQEKQERDRTQKPPRVWESLCEVPHAVVVKDRTGDRWDYYINNWGFGTPGETGRMPVDMDKYGDQAWDHFGPFTEVLDIEQKDSE